MRPSGKQTKAQQEQSVTKKKGAPHRQTAHHRTKAPPLRLDRRLKHLEHPERFGHHPEHLERLEHFDHRSDTAEEEASLQIR